MRTVLRGEANVLGSDVRLHATSAWHPKVHVIFRLAANVKYHGASPWHLSETKKEAQTIMSLVLLLFVMTHKLVDHDSDAESEVILSGTWNDKGLAHRLKRRWHQDDP